MISHFIAKREESLRNADIQQMFLNLGIKILKGESFNFSKSLKKI